MKTGYYTSDEVNLYIDKKAHRVIFIEKDKSYVVFYSILERKKNGYLLLFKNRYDIDILNRYDLHKFVFVKDELVVYSMEDEVLYELKKTNIKYLDI